MIVQRVDIIVIALADFKALISALKKAIDAGISVVNIDNKPNAAVLVKRNLKILYVGTNFA